LYRAAQQVKIGKNSKIGRHKKPNESPQILEFTGFWRRDGGDIGIHERQGVFSIVLRTFNYFY